MPEVQMQALTEVGKLVRAAARKGRDGPVGVQCEWGARRPRDGFDLTTYIYIYVFTDTIDTTPVFLCSCRQTYMGFKC